MVLDVLLAAAMCCQGDAHDRRIDCGTVELIQMCCDCRCGTCSLLLTGAGIVHEPAPGPSGPLQLALQPRSMLHMLHTPCFMCPLSQHR